MSAKPNPPPSLKRRRLLQASVLLLATGGIGYPLARSALRNPCLPAEAAGMSDSPLLQHVWQGLNPEKIWDCHVHLVGMGDSDSGIVVNKRLTDPLQPMQYAQRLFYMNAGCVHDAPGQVDGSYVSRLLNQVDAIPSGFKLVLFAFDHVHDDQGNPLADQSAFYVPNTYTRHIAAQYPHAFEWAASIHPYRADALEQLEWAIAHGARAIKWLPAAMNINPDDPRCQPFYNTLARTGLPLISHCGEEKAVPDAETQHLGNPLLLRRALDTGVRVVVAHCATVGEDQDLDQGSSGPKISSFELFARLMDKPEYRQTLFGDISAITLRNRTLDTLRTLLTHTDWHPRLLNGSDYPLPGILPLISPGSLADNGLLSPEWVAPLETLRTHNPIYFDLALKRALNWEGQYFAPSIFETRNFFEAQTA